MYFIGSTPNGYVLMPTIEQQPSYLSYSYPSTPANFINPPSFNALNFITPTVSAAVMQAPQAITLNTSPPSMQLMQQTPSTLYAPQRFSTSTTPSQTNSYQPYTKNKADIYQAKSKRSGHVSKSHRVSSKRTTIDQINLQKSCPNCSKYWRNCKCSNIKNRPDPKPYCKFVPPRMLRKLMDNANNHEN